MSHALAGAGSPNAAAVEPTAEPIACRDTLCLDDVFTTKDELWPGAGIIRTFQPG